MDSLTQIALGAAVTVAVMGRTGRIGRNAAWGAVAGTLPDLDTFVNHGDAVLNMVLHRAETHALLYLSVFALLMGRLLARLHREPPGRWLLAMQGALLTHPLLDGMTVYGTRLGLPLTDTAFAVGSVFIIDPLYTLPLLGGLAWALWPRRAASLAWDPRRRALRGNVVGLVLATLYLAWSVAAQALVAERTRQTLAHVGWDVERLLVTPAPFNTLLWRVVAIGPDSYLEGHASLLDAPDEAGRWPIHFERFDRGGALLRAWAAHPAVAQLNAFSRGHIAMAERDGRTLLIDLRMGQEPYYTFIFDLGPAGADPAQTSTATTLRRQRPPVDIALPWLFERLQGRPVPVPWPTGGAPVRP